MTKPKSPARPPHHHHPQHQNPPHPAPPQDGCVYAANTKPGKGELWHTPTGHVGNYQKGEAQTWTGTITLELTAKSQTDLLIWASNLICATQEA